jgi:mannose-6-phosphate isomerase-like protein (cupin superfamily)
MKIVTVNQAMKRLANLNEEIRYRGLFEEEHFTSGIIAFRPSGKSAKQINHPDKDVVCHVLRGRGRLRVRRRQIPLAPGTICHIPKGTPHDFAAKRPADLVMFYSLIQTAGNSPAAKRSSTA